MEGHQQQQQQEQRRNNRMNPNVEALLMANNNIIHILGGQFQLKQTKILDIVLRLPPLFLMDQVLQSLKHNLRFCQHCIFFQILLYDMGLHFFSDRDPSGAKVHVMSYNMSDELQEMLSNGTTGPELEASAWAMYADVITTMAMNHFVSFVACFNLFWLSLLWISLSTRQLVAFYTYLLAFSCVPLSFAANRYTVGFIYSEDPTLFAEPGFPLSKFLGNL